MSTLIIGASGSMGARYRSILQYLGEQFVGSDIALGMTEGEIFKKTANAERIILCTPTENHYQWLQKLVPLGKPILCEKPITKSLEELENIFNLLKNYETEFSMTFQYSELVRPRVSNWKSEYNYFRTGKDGLYWDCLQIIALAQGEVILGNDSPVWKCIINGERINFTDMDIAYLNFVRKWLTGLIKQTPDMLFSIHEKTERIHSEHSK